MGVVDQTILTKQDAAAIESGHALKAAPSYRTGIIKNVCIYILLTECCERLCYYGLTGSMKVFLTGHLDFSNEMASSMTTVLPAIVYVTPLFGGWLADTYWGRYKTILVFSLIYIAGCALIAASSYATINSTPLFLVGLFVFVGLGSGGIKANVITLGGDQFDTKKPEEAKQQNTFFNYFYWAINIGALFSYGYLSQLAINGQGDLISQEDGFFASFVICSVALTVAVILFVAFSGRYIKTPPSGSAFASFISSFRQAARASKAGFAVLIAIACQVIGWLLSTVSAFIPAGADSSAGISPALILSIAGMFFCVVGLVVVIIFCMDPSWVYIDGAAQEQEEQNNEKARLRAGAVHSIAMPMPMPMPPRRTNSMQMQRAYSHSMSIEPTHAHDALPADQTQESFAAKTYDFMRIMPILMFSVIFWIVYNQMAANFYSQSCQMNIFFNQADGGQLNGSVLNVADSLAIIICIPFFGTFVYPFVERCKGSPYTPLQKIGTGFVTAFLAMVSAIVIEFMRRDAPLLFTADGKAAMSLCSAGKDHQQMSDISVYYMLIPYFLIGVSECLISVQMYDMCYNEVPEELRSTAQAVNLFMTAISGAIAGAISKAFASYVHNDLNTSHIEYQYYVAAALAFVAVPLFIVCTRNFVYKERDGGAAAEVEADARELCQLTLIKRKASEV